MAAGKDQPKPVVGNGVVFSNIVIGADDLLDECDLWCLGPKIGVAAQPVQGLAPRRLHQPCSRGGGQSVARPVNQRRFQSVLQAVLGKLEVTQIGDEAGEQPSAIVAHERGDGVPDSGLVDTTRHQRP